MGGFVGAYVGAYVSTGSLSTALTAGLISGVTAGAFNYVGGLGAVQDWGVGLRKLAHAAVGCGSAVLSGGNCGKGAAAAALSEAASESGVIKVEQIGTWGSAVGAAEAGIIGGAAAAIVGGNFKDGFSIGAAGYLFNAASHLGLKNFRVFQRTRMVS